MSNLLDDNPPAVIPPDLGLAPFLLLAFVLPPFLKNKPDTRAVELPNTTVRGYLVSWLTRWVRDFGVGSLIAMMLPFSIAFGGAGLLLVTVWAALGLPVGPGAPAHYPLPGP